MEQSKAALACSLTMERSEWALVEHVLESVERQDLEISHAFGGAVANQGADDVRPAACGQLLLDGIIHLQPNGIGLVHEQQFHQLIMMGIHRQKSSQVCSSRLWTEPSDKAPLKEQHTP